MSILSKHKFVDGGAAVVVKSVTHTGYTVNTVVFNVRCSSAPARSTYLLAFCSAHEHCATPIYDCCITSSFPVRSKILRLWHLCLSLLSATSKIEQTVTPRIVQTDLSSFCWKSKFKPLQFKNSSIW